MNELDIDGASFVTLGIGDELFGIDVGYVREILDFRSITALPHAPDYLLGMIDVRGITVPVIDLRVKLGLSHAEETQHTRILVLEIPTDRHCLVIGLLADRVFEVTGLDGGLMEPPPEIGVQWRSDYIRGVGRRGNSFIIVFDLARLFSNEEIALLK